MKDNKENFTSSFENGTEDSSEKINEINDIFNNHNNLDINFNSRFNRFILNILYMI